MDDEKKSVDCPKCDGGEGRMGAKALACFLVRDSVDGELHIPHGDRCWERRLVKISRHLPRPRGLRTRATSLELRDGLLIALLRVPRLRVGSGKIGCCARRISKSGN